MLFFNGKHPEIVSVGKVFSDRYFGRGTQLFEGLFNIPCRKINSYQYFTISRSIIRGMTSTSIRVPILLAGGEITRKGEGECIFYPVFRSWALMLCMATHQKAECRFTLPLLSATERNRMAFSEFELKRYEKLMNGYIEQNRPPIDVRHELDLGF